MEACLISPKRSGRLEDAPAEANFQTQKEPSHGSGMLGGVPTLYVEVGQTSFSLTKKLVNAIFVVSSGERQGGKNC